MSLKQRMIHMLGLWLGFAIPAGGQSARIADPFASVTGAMLCHAPPVSPADSAVFVFEFIQADSLGGTRRTIAAYGSDGAPLYATIAVMENSGGEGARRALVFAVRLVPKAIGSRILVVGDRIDSTLVSTAADSAAGLPRGARLLTPGELEEARALSVWLWKRRCGERNQLRPEMRADTSRKPPPHK
jgi:hypothetical protein